MQPRAWFIFPPKGKPHGPSFTEWQAKVEAARLASGRPTLDPETALILWRSLYRAGWGVGHTNTKLIPAPPHPPPPSHGTETGNHPD